MGAWNERNAAVLQLLSEEELTVAEVSAKLGCCRSNAETAMLKMYRFGQLDRKLVTEGHVTIRETKKGVVSRPRTVYRYWTTEKGGERLGRISLEAKKKGRAR